MTGMCRQPVCFWNARSRSIERIDSRLFTIATSCWNLPVSGTVLFVALSHCNEDTSLMLAWKVCFAHNCWSEILSRVVALLIVTLSPVSCRPNKHTFTHFSLSFILNSNFCLDFFYLLFSHFPSFFLAISFSANLLLPLYAQPRSGNGILIGQLGFIWAIFERFRFFLHNRI